MDAIDHMFAKPEHEPESDSTKFHCEICDRWCSDRYWDKINMNGITACDCCADEMDCREWFRPVNEITKELKK